MVVAVVFLMAKKRKQAKCPSVNEWMGQKEHIHIMEYSSTMKKNEVLIHATT